MKIIRDAAYHKQLPITVVCHNNSVSYRFWDIRLRPIQCVR